MEKSVINVEKCIGQINAMSKTDFHQKILRGVAASEEQPVEKPGLPI